MKNMILFLSFLGILFSQEEDPDFFKIEGEYTQTINQSIDIVRAECTAKAIDNAIDGYILHDEIPEENVEAIINCLRSKLVQISVIDESIVQTNFTITIKAFIAEESVGECLWLVIPLLIDRM